MKAKKSRTPENVMGSQGTPAKIPASHHVARPTGNKQFPVK